jgi:DNA-directed RNA polymerase II subunit RPB2
MSNWKIIESFYKKNDLTGLQIESYNRFINEYIPAIIKEQYTILPLNNTQTLYVNFHNVYIDKPYTLDANRNRKKLYPYEARDRNLSYETGVNCNIELAIIDKKTNLVINSQMINAVELFKLPVMINSSLCNLNTTYSLKNEEMYNSGGYFIIKGKERVIVAQERINYNQTYVFKQKHNKYTHIAEIRSIKEGADYSVLLQMKLHLDEYIYLSVPYITHDIPIAILFIALGLPFNDILPYIENMEDVYKVLEKSYRPYSHMTTEECISYISDYTANKVEDSKKISYTKHILENELIPHLGVCIENKHRILFLIKMLIKLLDTANGKRAEDDRDHICNKRIEMVGELMGNLINSLFKKFMKTIQQIIEKKDEIHKVEDINFSNIINRSNITKRLYYCFSTGNWGLPKSNYIRLGVSQILSRLSYIGTMSHLRRVVVPIGKKSRNTQVRQIHSTNFGFICPCETPEGQSVGIVKNFALMTKISNHIHTVELLSTFENIFKSFNFDFNLSRNYFAIYINGRWIGSIPDTQLLEFIQQFKHFRHLEVIPKFVSIGVDPADMEINISSDGGRILRPVINTDFIHLLEDAIQNTPVESLWDKLLTENIVTYIDGNEAESSVIAMNMQELQNNPTQYNYCEIHPSLMLGLCANTTPFPEHSQAPRNVYVAAMMKQAIGMYALSHNIRYDTIANVLCYPQRKLATTKYAEFCHCEDMPSGMEAIVAVMCYTGYNQEDSVILNQSAIDRGLFHSIAFKTTMTSENKKGTHDCEVIELPSTKLQNSNYDYSKLNEHGIIPLNTVVKKNDVLVGKVYYNNDAPVSDCSLICKSSEEGIIDKILITTNSSGYKLIKIKIRQMKIPEIGDKFCQVSAQKGTCGMTYRQEDMPFTADGIVPDLIINPHALPSRMTINMLLEMLSSKVACFNGTIQDASAFEHDGEVLAEEMGNELVKLGYDRMGTEVMYNGFTGVPFKAKIFIGPAYYQRLKHLVSNKMHARSYGNVQLLSQQPCAGRAREGGLKFGEMERDCAIVHGISSFLKERLFDLSDPYKIYICAKCGVCVNSNTVCMMCKSDSIEKIQIPYACKLLFQQLEAMNMKIRIKT